MKILIVSQYYYPEQFQINEIAPELVRRGHKVTVLCGLPNYPEGKVFTGYEDKKYRHEVINGVEVVRVWQVPRGKGIFQLCLNYLSYWFKANRALSRLSDTYDVVLSYQMSPVTSAFPAMKYKRIAGVPSIIYCMDLWPESIRANIPSKSNPVYKLVHRLSKNVYNAFDRVLVSSTPFKDYLHDVNGVDYAKMGYLPQHGDDSMLYKDLSKTADGVVDFMFAGNLGMAQTLDVIVKAAARLGKRDDYRIHFVGDGSRREMAEALTKEYGLEKNIVFHGKHDRKEMPSFYKMADVLLITLRGNNAVGLTVPSKLQTYMTTGKPIIGAIDGATPQIIADAGCGRCVAAGDFEGLASLMKDVIENRGRYASCGENARKYFADNFSLGIFVDRLEREFDNLVAARKDK